MYLKYIMDSDWVFNNDCNCPIKKTSVYFDNKIIPEVFLNAVSNRNKNQMYTVIKNNPKLSKEIIVFFQLTLANAFNFKKNANFGAPVKIHWKLKNNEQVIINFNEQVEYYQYILKRQWNLTHFGYLFNTIRSYLSELSYGLYLIKSKNCQSKCYYKYGINITNDDEYRVFAMKFI